MLEIELNHPYLILIRGLPGGGKTYLAQALAKRLGQENVVLLDPDAIDHESEAYKAMAQKLAKEGVDEKFYPYRFSRSRAYEGIESNKVVVWNQAFTNLDGFQKTVVNLQNYARDHGTELPLLVVEVEIDPEVAKARIAERSAAGGHDVPSENFERFVTDYRSFENEGFNTIRVHGEADVNESVDSIIARLRAL